MDSNQVIYIMIFVCFAMMGLLFLAKPIKVAGKLCLNVFVGGAGFFLANLILQPFEIFVGINFLTLGVVGVLGIPGFCATLIISALL